MQKKGMFVMKRRISATVIVFTLLFGMFRAEASDVISGGLSDLAMAAKRYYQTELAEADMVIKRVADEQYKIYYKLKNGNDYYVTLDLKEWGVWNLGDMTIADGIEEKNVVGGSTDWEYVFRVYNPVTQVADFTGGNHGAEEMLWIRFFDDVTGEEFELEVGEEKQVRRLVVEEQTKLHYSSSSDLIYANVTRNYTFVGTRVNLDTKIEFTRDVSMTHSYTAMASVNKSFGRYCSFDGIETVTTSGHGSHNNEYYGKITAAECTLSGDDETATLTVGIFNKSDMTNNFSNDDKVFLWDMSDDYTKLYFSKYDMSSVTTVKAGEEWNLSTYWQCNVAGEDLYEEVTEEVTETEEAAEEATEAEEYEATEKTAEETEAVTEETTEEVTEEVTEAAAE